MKSWLKIGLFILAVAGVAGTAQYFLAGNHLHHQSAGSHSPLVQKGDVPAPGFFLPTANFATSLFRVSSGNPSVESSDHKHGTTVNPGSLLRPDRTSARILITFRPDIRSCLKALLYPFHTHW
jgi:hypothetical protein